MDQIPSVEGEDEEEEEEEETHQPLTSTDSQRFEAERKKFNTAIDTLDNALARLEKLWISNDRTSVERDVSQLVNAVDEQISSLFSQLLTGHPSLSNTHSSDQRFFLHQPQRLVYSKTTDIKDEQRLIKEKDLQDETRRWNDFQRQIDQHIEEQRAILDQLSHHFDHVMIV